MGGELSEYDGGDECASEVGRRIRVADVYFLSVGEGGRTGDYELFRTRDLSSEEMEIVRRFLVLGGD